MKNVLVVDDEEDIRKMFQDIAPSTVSMHTASNAEEAMATVRTIRYDLILTDNNMPGIKGTDLIRAIRNNDTINRNTQIWLMSGDSPADTIREKAYNVGANRFYEKPTDAGKLFSDLEQFASS